MQPPERFVLDPSASGATAGSSRRMFAGPELSDVYQNPISAEGPALLSDVLPTFRDLWSRRIVV